MSDEILIGLGAWAVAGFVACAVYALVFGGRK